MSSADKPLVWLAGEIASPPFSARARREAGYLLRMLQRGEKLAMPHCRPMPTIGPRCFELRIADLDRSWRIVCRVDEEAIVIVHVFDKRSRRTPKLVVASCRERLKRYDAC